MSHLDDSCRQLGSAIPNATGQAAGGDVGRAPRVRAWLPAIVIVAGIGYSLFLLSHVRDEVFYSGDGGLKALLVKQFSDGRVSDALDLPAEPWVKDLWDEGLYPFGPPFVYDLARGRVVAFPLLFVLLTTPFYQLLGVVGLYVVPVVSLWLLWLRLGSVARRLGVPPGVTAAALGVLVFATPLTLYGAMFWEHTLGVLLTFCGVDFLLTTAWSKRPMVVALAWGALAGLSVWVRSELICLVGALAALGAVRAIRDRERRAGWFVLGLTLAVGTLWGINTLLYGHPFGMHGFQVVGETVASLGERGYWPLLVGLAIHMPVVVFAPLFLLRALQIEDPGEGGRVRRLVFLAAFFFLAAPWVIPNMGGKQWGPRYLLVLAPLACLLGALLLAAALRTRRGPERYGTIAVFVAALLFGGYVNTYAGSLNLAQDYRLRVRPALDFLRQSDQQFVAVRRQWIVQELEAALERKTFFWVRDDRQFEALSIRLHEHGCSSFLLIAEADERPPAQVVFDSPASPLAGITITPLGPHGAYYFYGVEALAR